MLRVSDSQLPIKLAQQDSLRYFITVGNDPYLQYTSQNTIKQTLVERGFVEQYLFIIDNQTDWQQIEQTTQTIGLFSEQLILILQFGDLSLTTPLVKKLNELTVHLSDDISLLISLPKMVKTQENADWFKTLSDHLMIVSCNTPDATQLPQWVAKQLPHHGLTLEKQSIELLCYYYEGNLLALSQILEQLKLLYPTGKVSYAQLESQITDMTIFTPYHWIVAIIAGKPKRAIHILQQLKISDIEPLILLRTIQRELIQLINLKKYSIQHNLKMAYDVYKVWQTRRNLMTPYLNKVSIEQLYQILSKLTEIEIILKHDYQSPVWEHLTTLTMLFIGKQHD